MAIFAAGGKFQDAKNEGAAGLIEIFASGKCLGLRW